MLHIKRPCLGGADNHKVGVGVNAWGPSLPVAYGTPTEAHLVRKKLKAPFPYFGGKARVAPLVWQRLGDVDNAIEPFCGSAAFLLARPHPPRIETVNDLDCYIANFWRAIQHDPEAVASHADWPVNEIDLHARHRWLVGIDSPSPWTDTPYLHAMAGPGKWTRARAEFRERMRADPDHYDSKIAGWWCWGLCAWIGGGWCATPEGGAVNGPIGGSGERRPKIDEGVHYGNGVHAKGERPHQSQQVPGLIGGKDARGVHGRPQLADAYSRGRGVHGTDAADRYLSQKRPRAASEMLSTDTGQPGVCGAPLGETDGTCASRRAWLIDWFSRLRDRLRTVRVCSGHWLRVCDSESVTTRLGVTGIFADPPYPHSNPDGSSSRSEGLYAQDDPDKVRDELLAYCLERGGNPMMRICVAAYDTDGYAVLEGHGWDVVAWKTQGGYGNRSKKGRANAKRERLYFSPGCVKPDLGLFAGLA
jgi:hypothetical protein